MPTKEAYVPLAKAEIEKFINNCKKLQRRRDIKSNLSFFYDKLSSEVSGGTTALSTAK